jgi:hypothetical protein
VDRKTGQVSRLTLPFAVMELDADDRIGPERGGAPLEGGERRVVPAHRLVGVDDADHLGGAVEARRLQDQYARFLAGEVAAGGNQMVIVVIVVVVVMIGAGSVRSLGRRVRMPQLVGACRGEQGEDEDADDTHDASSEAAGSPWVRGRSAVIRTPFTSRATGG